MTDIEDLARARAAERAAEKRLIDLDQQRKLAADELERAKREKESILTSWMPSEV